MDVDGAQLFTTADPTDPTVDLSVLNDPEFADLFDMIPDSSLEKDKYKLTLRNFKKTSSGRIVRLDLEKSLCASEQYNSFSFYQELRKFCGSKQDSSAQDPWVLPIEGYEKYDFVLKDFIEQNKGNNALDDFLKKLYDKSKINSLLEELRVNLRRYDCQGNLLRRLRQRHTKVTDSVNDTSSKIIPQRKRTADTVASTTLPKKARRGGSPSSNLLASSATSVPPLPLRGIKRKPEELTSNRFLQQPISKAFAELQRQRGKTMKTPQATQPEKNNPLSIALKARMVEYEVLFDQDDITSLDVDSLNNKTLQSIFSCFGNKDEISLLFFNEIILPYSSDISLDSLQLFKKYLDFIKQNKYLLNQCIVDNYLIKLDQRVDIDQESTIVNLLFLQIFLLLKNDFQIENLDRKIQNIKEFFNKKYPSNSTIKDVDAILIEICLILNDQHCADQHIWEIPESNIFYLLNNLFEILSDNPRSAEKVKQILDGICKSIPPEKQIDFILKKLAEKKDKIISGEERLLIDHILSSITSSKIENKIIANFYFKLLEYDSYKNKVLNDKIHVESIKKIISDYDNIAFGLRFLTLSKQEDQVLKDGIINSLSSYISEYLCKRKKVDIAIFFEIKKLQNNDKAKIFETFFTNIKADYRKNKALVDLNRIFCLVKLFPANNKVLLEIFQDKANELITKYEELLAEDRS